MRIRVVWLALVLASERVAAGFWSVLRPAEVRRHREPRRPLRLDQTYYPARGTRGYELVPRDAFFEEVERLLHQVARRD